MRDRAVQPPTFRGFSARRALFAVVASVLALSVAHAPRHEDARPENDSDVVANVPARSAAEVRALEALRAQADSFYVLGRTRARARARTRVFLCFFRVGHGHGHGHAYDSDPEYRDPPLAWPPECAHLI